MKIHETEQFAFADYYAVQLDGQLVAGRPSFAAGMTIQKPRLYTTLATAKEAALTLGGEAVKLAAKLTIQKEYTTQPTGSEK